MESLKAKVTLPVSADKLYKAWLSSKEHTAFTGGAAKINDNVNGKHTAWDGYITGKNLNLVKNKQIVQTWRASEWAKDDLDSTFIINLLPKGKDVVLEQLDLV